ncbi:Phage protein [Yersinia phage fHe-Yen9-04]|uniref:Phage protein n=1 Tax=Yersinia phage fHe-Yen9-04 TaxID=2052742 RepID=A0A2C9CY03_9CAUD|nr:HNH endonuclease [Yersinia phage fHe-Yen9-04]SOK58727.1 Phage protein [Yersinia phage fHe-Yen9-04]VUE36496.1 Phage protein [Yersinia phage fHe-Yen9-04]
MKKDIDNSKVISMIEQGRSVRDIAKECNVAYSTMNKYFKNNNLKSQYMIQLESPICFKHNVEFTKRNNSNKRICWKCNAENVSKHRKKLKIKSVEYLGGKCERCGYNKSMSALEFHHKDPSEKDFEISAKGITRSWQKIQIELDKCMLLCSNCHREIHDELNLEN